MEIKPETVKKVTYPLAAAAAAATVLASCQQAVSGQVREEIPLQRLGGKV